MNESNEPGRLAERVANLERRMAALEARSFPLSRPPSPASDGAEAVPPPLPPLPHRSPAVPATGGNKGSEIPKSNVPAVPIGWPEDERTGTDWRVFLRQWHLWPPVEAGDAEVRVGAWWATRIGALLLVIGVVFFAVYLAQEVSPAFRFIQLAAAALGLTVAGHWFERREPRFGGVVLGSGLALVFFTAFAAYVVPAVKVIGHPVLATGFQAAALLAIGSVSWWKNRASLATMAILLGYVTCLFSLVEQLHGLSLVAAFLLAAGAAGLWLLRGWLAPLAVAVPAAHLIHGMIAGLGWRAEPPASFFIVMLFPVSMFLLLTAGDFLRLWTGREMKAAHRRILHGINLAGAAGLGFWTTHRFFPESATVFYLAFSMLSLVAAALYHRRDKEDELAQWGFAAGMGFLALGLIEFLDARTRWIALAVQSLVALHTAGKTRLWTAEAVMAGLWLAAAGLFLHDSAAAGLFREPAAILSIRGLAATVYLVLTAALVSLQARSFQNHPVVPGLLRRELSPEDDRRHRRLLNLGYSAMLGFLAMAWVWTGFEAFRPAGAMAGTLLLAMTGLFCRHRAAIRAAAAPFLFGQILFWISAPTPESAAPVWVNAGMIIPGALLLAIGFRRAIPHKRVPAEWAGPGLANAHALWLISTQALLFHLSDMETSLLISSLLAVALLGMARWRKASDLALAVPIPVLLAWAGILWSWLNGLHNLPANGNVLVQGLAFGLMVAAISTRDATWKWPRPQGWPSNFSRMAGVATVIWTGVFLISREVAFPYLSAALALTGAAVTALGRWPGWSSATLSAAAFALAGHGAFLFSLSRGYGDELPWTLLLAALTLLPAVLAARQWQVHGKAVGQFLSWTLSVATTGSLFLLFLTRTGPMEPFTTVFWGAGAGAVFLTGLAWKAKPARLVGLAGLAICIPRVFMVDIHSTLYRIAAFLVLGSVLLLIGFLYHRFRQRLTG